MAMDFRLLDPNAAARGVEQVNAWADAAAKRRAGRQIADGNEVGAQDILNQNGLLGDAMNVRQNVWAEQNREIAATERARAEEDRQRGIQLAAEKREAEVLGTMATNLQAVLTEHGPEAILPAFDQMAASWMANGADPQSVAQMRSALETNPEQFLTATAGAVNAANQRYQLWQSGGSVGTFDRRTGTVDEQFRAPQYKTVGTGQDLVEIDGRGGLSGGPEAPSDGAPAPTGRRPAGGTGALEGASNARQAIETLFPGVRVTGGDRSRERNTAVGGAENSWHLREGRAVDIAPIEGETVASVKRRLESEGWVVHEALDETRQTNGTGPHWHFAMSPPTGINPGRAALPSAPQGGAPGTRVIARGRDPQPRATGAQWRQMTPQEVQAAGLREGGSYQINTNGQTRVAQAPPAAGRGATGQGGTPRLSPQDNAFLVKLRTDYGQGQGLANIAAQMEPLARNVDTGGFMAMPGAGSVIGAVNPEVRRFMALTDQMTPGMRQGLPGAASDRDVAMFRSATPSIDKPREANLAAIAAIQAWSGRQGDYVAFMEQWARDHGSLLGAAEEWGRYTASNPLFEEGTHGMPRVRRVTPWRSWFQRPRSGSAPSAPSGSPQRRRFNPATGRVE